MTGEPGFSSQNDRLGGRAPRDNVLACAPFATAAASAALSGAASAVAAPDVVGQTYGDAKATISQTGAAVSIATRTGGLSEEGDCNNALAAPGSPGNSLASPEGRKASAAQEETD